MTNLRAHPLGEWWRLRQVPPFAAGLEPKQKEQCAFGVRQRTALSEELVDALPRQPQQASEFCFLATPGELRTSDRCEFVPQWSLPARLEGQTALRPSVARAFYEPLTNRFRSGFGERHREIEWDAQRRGQLSWREMDAHPHNVSATRHRAKNICHLISDKYLRRRALAGKL